MSKSIDLSGPLYEGMWSYSSLLNLKRRIPGVRVQAGCDDRDGGIRGVRLPAEQLDRQLH